MNTAEFLKSAKALIADKNSWTKGAYARDFATGESASVSVGDCFCSLGACIRTRDVMVETTEDRYTVECKALVELRHVARDLSGTSDIVRFNDDKDTTHEDVMKMFDLAIEKASK